MAISLLGFASTCLAGIVLSAPQPPAPEPVARYEITYNDAPDADRLDVSVDVSGLDPAARDVSLYFEEWGRWTTVDSLYLRCVQSEPPARRDPSAGPVLRIDVPDGWDGSVRARHQIPLIEFGSALHAREGLLPWRSRGENGRPPYVVAFANNTLPRIVVNGAIVNVKPTVTLRAPAGMSAASGWAGASAAVQTTALDGNIAKTPILFGRPLNVAAVAENGTAFEVVQFSGVNDVSREVLDLVRVLTPCFAAMTGHPAGDVQRVFIVDGGGGQRTDYGLLIGMSAGSEGSVSSPYFKQFVAHELFHEWLGGAAHTDGESTVWFKEGFTDYLSIRGCAMTGIVSWDWFASRLLELEAEARASPACERVAFGDESANWRDGDGPNETLAYKGGAVLALAVDAELIARGHAGLPALIGDLAGQNGGAYALATIREWLTARGMAKFYEAHIARPSLPRAADALERAGFASTRTPSRLAYFGLATEGGGVFGRVTSVDPDGPAAAAGIRAGDVINGLYPVLPESSRPRISGTVGTEHRYGLDLCNPEAGPITVGIDRDGLQVPVNVRAMDGGETVRVAATPAVEKFFAPPQPR